MPPHTKTAPRLHGRVFAAALAATTLVFATGRLASAAAEVRVNEVLASNATGIVDEDGDRSDWVELHNHGDEAVDLAGWGLTDNPASPFKWAFPSRVLAPGAFLLVFASNKNRAGAELHSSFAISAGGESITLTRPDGTAADVAPATPLAADASLGRKPDGTGPWLLFQQATPGSANVTEGNAPAGAVDFSAPGGMYGEGFSLALSTTGAAAVHYTLDGSRPTSASPKYTTPIPIGSRAGEPNVHSLVPSSPPEGWNTPAGEVFKATVVRAVAIAPGFPDGPVATHTYLVDPLLRERYPLPVLSVVADPDDLWGYERGIYVPGRAYDEAFDPGVNWTARPANYRLSGDASEREGHLEVFETDGSAPIRQGVGLRIHGNLTRAFRRKTLRIYARAGLGGDALAHPFFGDEGPSSFRRILLRNGGQDFGRTLFRDAMLQGLVAQHGVSTQAWRPAIVFLDGEYWGIHNIRERFDQHYLASRFGVDADSVDLLTGEGEVEEGSADGFLDLRDHILQSDLSDPVAWARVEAEIDLDNLARYVASEVYFVNLDWPQNNIDYWRSPDLDGRWRWLLYDTDTAFGYHGGDAPWTMDALARLTGAIGVPGFAPPGLNGDLFSALLAQPRFRDLFLLRYAELLDRAFDPVVVIERIDRMQEILEPVIAEHIARWRTPFSPDVWRDNIDALRVFAAHRAGIAREQAVALFGLGGVARVRVENPTPGRGSLTVGSYALPDGTQAWEGTFFRGVPLPVSGQPVEGLRFRGFVGLDADEDAAAVLVPEADTTLVALFTACANGVLDDGEQCDDGNFAAGDGCNVDCLEEYCGDGAVNDTDEECDDGDAAFVPGDACLADCRAAACAMPRGSAGVRPGVADALHVLAAAVGSASCAPSVCDVDGSGSVTAADALATLRAAVGIEVARNCPAGG